MRILPGFFFFTTLLIAAHASGQTAQEDTVVGTGTIASGTLHVETVPSGQTVYIAHSDMDTAQELGITPLTVQMPEGHYSISIRSEGYQEAIAQVNLESGKEINVIMSLMPNDRTQELQRHMGHAFIWPGIVLTVTGIIMIESDSWGNVGKVGLVSAGLGVACTITGGILLGLSHRTRLRYLPPVAIAPLPGKGLALSYGITF